MSNQPILIDGQWRQARAESTFQACDPQNRDLLPDVYPVSLWEDCDQALAAAVQAADQLRKLPCERIAQLLETLAGKKTIAKTASGGWIFENRWVQKQ